MIILPIEVNFPFSSWRIGPNESFNDTNLETPYDMLLLQGETAITTGSTRPIVSDTFLLNSLDAVAVRAINLVSAATMLRTSLILNSVFRNVSPL